MRLIGVGAVGVAVAPLRSQETSGSGVESQLAAKLDERAKQLLQAALRANENSSRNRLRHKLTENSEPCTVFHPSVPTT